MDGEGIAGATFGIDATGELDWIEPEHAGCVEWGRTATFLPSSFASLRLARPQPNALLWVPGGAIYEVGADGVARHITQAQIDADNARYAALWKNMMPVSAEQMDGLKAKGLVR